MGLETNSATMLEESTLSRWYLGVARVHFSGLNFDHALTSISHRSYNDRNLNRLENIFKIQGGCDKSNEEYFISATVRLEDLKQSLEVSGHSIESLTFNASDTPYLDDIKVNCLHGLHRIKAASRVLDPSDHWWIIKLYEDALPHENKVKLVEKYENEQPFSDGDILWRIRHYFHSKDKSRENIWWARLTPAKQRDVKQLLKNDKFAAAFDNLLDKPGLWTGIQLGTLHRFLTLRCDEEIIRYLENISQVWNEILNRDTPRSAVDNQTVQQLELLAPAFSETDRDSVISLMSSDKIFAVVKELGVRQTILKNLLSIPTMIPSLRTLFENLKYIEPCCKILRQLAAPRKKYTLRQELYAIWNRPVNLVLECGPNDYRISPRTTKTDDFNIAYKSLWLFTFRNFSDMTDAVPRKDRSKDKPVSTSPNLSYWHSLGKLAVQLGFQTEEAVRLDSMQPHEAKASEFLKNNTSSLFNFDHVLTIANILREISTDKVSAPDVELTSRSTRLSGDQRCGRPFESSYKRDRNCLYLPLLHCNATKSEMDITTLFVKRDMLINFLGDDSFILPNKIEREGEKSAQNSICTRDSISESDEFVNNSSRLREENDSYQIELRQERSLRTNLEQMFREKLDHVVKLQNKIDTDSRKFSDLKDKITQYEANKAKELPLLHEQESNEVINETELKHKNHGFPSREGKILTIASEELGNYIEKVFKQFHHSEDLFKFFIVTKNGTTYTIHELKSIMEELSLETRKMLYRLRNLQDKKHDRIRIMNSDGHTIASSEPHIISEIWKHYHYLFGGLAEDLQDLKSILNKRAIENSTAKNESLINIMKGLKRGSDEFSENIKRIKTF